MDINLASDTSTQPTEPMRKAMYAAEVGDEQNGSDPTVNRLLQMVCELLGKEAAVFLPSGTMCNLIAELVHCPRGGGILLDATAHVLHAEGGGFAAIGGAIPHIIAGERGIYTVEQLAATQVMGSHYTPGSCLVWIEQTTNLGGGACWPLLAMQQVCEYAHGERMAAHLDGARLMNAVVATALPAYEYAAPFDSVWLGLTKGLGAPFGAVLAGSSAFIQEARQWKQRLGGAMRQAGIMAAAAVYALEHHVERLREDHAHAQLLASELASLSAMTVLQPVETNIVLVDIARTGYVALDFAHKMSERGIHLFAHPPTLGPSVLRLVTHMQIGTREIEVTLQAMKHVLAEKKVW